MPSAYTKSHFIREIPQANSLSREKSTETINTLLEIIKRTLESGEDVLIFGFGKLCIKDKKERLGRNSATEDDMMIRSRKVVMIKYSGKFRDNRLYQYDDSHSRTNIINHRMSRDSKVGNLH